MRFSFSGGAKSSSNRIELLLISRTARGVVDGKFMVSAPAFSTLGHMGEINGPSAPAGWYDDGSGNLRWWDGFAWGAYKQAVETSSNVQATISALEQPKKTGLGTAAFVFGLIAFVLGFIPWLSVILGITAIVIGIVALSAKQRRGHATAGLILGAIGALVSMVAATIAVGTSNYEASSSSSSSSESTESEASPAPEVTLTREEQLDKSMLEQGWDVYQSGQVYFQFADPSTYTCGYTGCTYVGIVSMDGCRGGFYVKIDVLSDQGTPIGWTNQISASANPEEPVTVRLDILESNAGGVRMAEINCLGF